MIDETGSKTTGLGDSRNMGRRGFLTAGAAGLATAAFAGWPQPANARTRHALILDFENLHTEETCNTMVWFQGAWLREGLERINHILRDHRAERERRIDPRLLILLADLRDRIGTDAPFQVISGYRTPKTNAMLRRQSLAVAKNSYHCKGMAIDIRLPATRLSTLHRTALAMSRGGVGYYPRSDFVHVDTGPVRHW